MRLYDAAGQCFKNAETKISYYVDIVFGTYNLYKLPELMNTRMESGDTIYDIWQEHEEIVEDLPSIRHFPYKASVNIMFGCNNFCTYCISPMYGGGSEVVKLEDIVASVRSLLQMA